MRFVMFYHSLESCWNHGNAHFLRGIVAELLDRGHEVTVYEPEDGWSRQNLLAEHGPEALAAFRQQEPRLISTVYRSDELDPEEAVRGADVVLVHEWNPPALVAAIGQARRKSDFTLLFHDTHHRAVSAPDELAAFDLQHYDGALVFGRILERLYAKHGWAKRAFTWHEAADTRLFKPLPPPFGEPKRDLVWVGNWGDDERTRELHEFLIDPIAELKLSADVFGVRYPQEAKEALARVGARYRGWLPNLQVPQEFARSRMTVHVPRRHYASMLEGIPTIRPFEAMACGIPLICAPWNDVEELFTPGVDYLVARNGDEMRSHMRGLLAHPDRAQELGAQGRRTILERHTCAHRVSELLSILGELEGQGKRRQG